MLQKKLRKFVSHATGYMNAIYLPKMGYAHTRKWKEFDDMCICLDII